MGREVSISERISTAAARMRDWAGAVAGPDGFEVTYPELVVAGLDPAHDGLRVAQLSDIHVGMNTPDERVRAALREVNALAPDLVFLTGDFVTYSKRPMPLIRELLDGLAAPTFAVLGNHDHIVDATAVVASLESRGYATLRNQHTVIHVKGAPLTCSESTTEAHGTTMLQRPFAAHRGARPAS